MLKSLISLGLVCMLLLGPAAAMAQTGGTGALTGTVTDSSGAIVPEAQIKVVNEATGEERVAQTNDAGFFVVPALLPGSYRVEITKDGFKLAIKTGLRINVSETARLDVQLEVGEVSATMEVTAEATVLQTESAELGRVVNQEAIVNLPLVTRNYTQILALSPGVAASVNNATELGRGQVDMRSHGSFSRDNNFQMNGVTVNDLQDSGLFSGGHAIPNPDAIQEFKVQTGQFDAAYGRNAGAVVNVVTRSGSNEFHGSLYHFFRNDALNANDFFRNATNQERGILRQNQFGGTIGGPVKRDKLLFFGSYQGTRQINGVGSASTSSLFSPPLTDDRSPQALGRLFAGQRGQLQDAFGGVGPAIRPDGSNINPVALALLNMKLPNGQYLIPTPQTVDPSRPFSLQGFSTFSFPAEFNEDQYIGNVDFLHTTDSKFAVRYFFANTDQNQPLPISNLAGVGITVPGFPLLTESEYRNFTLTHTYSLSPTLLNQASFGYHRIFAATIQEEPFTWSDIGVTAPPNANPYPSIYILGSMALGGNGQGVEIPQQHFTFQDDMTWVRGNHTLRFGGGITRSHLDIKDFHFFGGLIFLSWADFLLGLPAGAEASGGNGTPFSNIFISLDLPGDFDRQWRVWDGNLYFQDDWKVTPSLTLNLGLRYDRLGQLADRLGRNSGFDSTLADPNPPAGGTLAGFVVSKNFQGTVPAGVKQLDNELGILGEHQNNFGPRIGFAWKMPDSFIPFTERMVLRGGYGIYYTRATGQPFLQLVASPPFAQLRQLSGVQNGQASFANPFQPAVEFPLFPAYSPATQHSILTVAQDYRPPVTQQYSLNLQTDIGGDMLLEVGYVGTHGTHQIIGRSRNQAMLASPSNPIRGEMTNTVANISQRVPILGWTASGMATIESIAESWYNGLEVSLTKRWSKGLQFVAAYTFANAYSNAGANTSAGGSSAPGNQLDLDANYGRSDFNRRHRLVISYVYELPGTRRLGPVFNELLSGWSISGVTTFQSGAPLTLTGQNAANIYGIVNDRAELAPGCTHADLVTKGSVNSKLNNYFVGSCINRDAAGNPAWRVIGDDGVGTDFGNSGVGIVFGPDQRNFDIALAKRIRAPFLGESGNIEFRSEFFNAFNTPQFANPDTSVSSATFGVISRTAVNPRIIQFALKLNF